MSSTFKKDKKKGRFVVACDHCGRFMDWEQAQILPAKKLCKKCFVYLHFAKIYAKVLMSLNALKIKGPQHLFKANPSDNAV